MKNSNRLDNALEALEFKALHDNVREPVRVHTTDAGIDLYATESITIRESETLLVPTGLAVAIPVGYEGTIRPKSGITLKSPLKVQLGTIDAGYRGELKVIVTAIGIPHYENGATETIIHAGQKIAQLVVSPVATPHVVMVETFNEDVTDRGDGGFGSTGVK